MAAWTLLYLLEACVAMRVDITGLYKEEYAAIPCFVSANIGSVLEKY